MPAPKGVSPKKYESCVQQVKRKGEVTNPWAVCAAALNKAVQEEDSHLLENEELEKFYEEDIEKAYIGFDKLVQKLKSSKNPPKDPEAVAAAIGRKKYGKEAFQSAAKRGKRLQKSQIVELVQEAFKEREFNKEEAMSLIKSEINKESVETTEITAESTTEITVEAAAETAVETVEQVVETPVKEVKLAPGLFKDFTLGSTLHQGQVGNVITNLKTSKINYVEAATHTKNQKFTEEDLKNLKNLKKDK